ncbi:MAG: ribonucleotide-diphosphate reductase subunit alpha, partial [Bacteroidota bacterium]
QEAAQAPATAGGPKRTAPRERPRVTFGVTERVKTGEGYLYVTINEDETGLCEVFTTIGKAGGNAAAQSEAISRLISLALRAGVDPLEIVKQLKGISGPMPVWDGHGGQVLSTPDAIGKVLERYVENREQLRHYQPEAAPRGGRGEMEVPPEEKDAAPGAHTACPECGSNVEHVSGCVVCYNCGWSRC